MIRVRFAPTPNGSLFVSGARVALANHLFVRRSGGEMLLRLDDLDQERCRQGSSDQIVQDLRWFGIEWHESFRQSDRLDRYQETIERLKRDQFIYPCFESSEELRAKQEFRRKRKKSAIYDRGMLGLTDKQRYHAEAGGKRPHWRFKLSGRTREWHDLILGTRSAALSTVSDPILVRGDGTPTPILAGVVDDIAYGTTHIIRSEDNAGSTAVQIELFEVLGGRRGPISFGHLPALSDSSSAPPGGRRTDHLALRNLRHDGVEPGAIAASMLAIADEPLSVKDLAGQFGLADLATSRFDLPKMLALNRRAQSGLGFAAVVDRLPAGATEVFWQAVRGKLDLLREARGWWDVVAGTIVPPVINGARDLLLAAGSLLPPEPWDNTVWATWIGALERATGCSGEALLRPLRLALTGEDSGPELADLLPLIGRPRAASRLMIAAT
jgi:glutamyl-tRNA synthetase